MKLNELQVGQTGLIQSVGGEGALRQHFLDMGVIPGAEIALKEASETGYWLELLYKKTILMNKHSKI